MLKKRIRVAFFAEILVEDSDGASRTMFQLINRIDPAEFEFLFICGTGPDRISGFECLKIPSITLPVNASYTMALPVLIKTEIKEKLNTFLPDVIHIATPSLLGNFALKYAQRNFLPVLSIYHTHFISYIDYYLKHTPFLINKVKQLVAESHKTFYNQCDTIYIPSETIKDELTLMGIEVPRMKLWKRGMDTQLFSPKHRNPELLRQLTGNNDPTIFFASRLVWEKNLETLFAIYNTLQEQNIKVNFVIAGDGTAKTACEASMKNAIFLGKVDHKTLAVLYASATIFLFPSISETYGNVVLEAMASGLPCIIADGGGSRDSIEQGINGFKCSPYLAKDFAEKIVILLNDRQLRNQFIEKGLQQSKAFNWSELAIEYFNDLKALSEVPQLELV